ncbi:unnamed protein product [Malus baccata var. baccata]
MSRIVRGQGEKSEESVAVAIDKDKGSEHAIKWAVDHLLARGQPLTLLHVDQTSSPEGSDPQQTQGLFLSFRSFCSKKNIKCNEVVIKDTDIPNAIIGYVMVNTIEILVLGTPSKSGIFRSPFARGRPSMDKSYELSPETDISFVSSGRPSIDRMSPRCDFGVESGMNSRLSISSDGDNRNMGSLQCEMSSCSIDSGKSSSSSQNMDDVESEMRRLKLELKQTMEMYSTTCKEALIEKHKEKEINQWKMEDEQRLEAARHAEEVALALVEKEKAKYKAAIEAAEAAQRIFELEAQKRKVAKMKALKESEEKNKALQAMSYNLRYRKYTIQEIEKATNDFSQDRNIGEGGYGPVYRGELDHTPVAIKILHPDAAQGQSQFKQEVEVLSCIRHPNMVLLLGACPDYGCLVYEYMGNGSLEDRLFSRGNCSRQEFPSGMFPGRRAHSSPGGWRRDLKPGNILLDHNYVSKISDVGLARLVPPSVANAVTQYHMTSTPPMGLTHHVEQGIETGTFAEMLDPAVPDWPVEEALKFAKLCLQCPEMRRKDRPDLGKVVLPELNRLRALADESLNCVMLGATGVFSPRQRSNPSIQVSCTTSNLNCIHAITLVTILSALGLPFPHDFVFGNSRETS